MSSVFIVQQADDICVRFAPERIISALCHRALAQQPLPNGNNFDLMAVVTKPFFLIARQHQSAFDLQLAHGVGQSPELR